MEIKSADTKDGQYKMTWDEVLSEIRIIAKRTTKFHSKIKIWGIPRGGKIVEGLMISTNPQMYEAACSPEDADYFVDDIIDSGASAKRYQEKFNKGTIALVDRSQYDAWIQKSWIIFPWEIGEVGAAPGPEDNVTRLLQYIGEDVTREGLVKTPHRVVKAMKEMTEGYHQDPKQILSTSFDAAGCDEMVILQGIRFASLCEHHMLPFTGEAAVAYLPGTRVVGISKLARLVQCYAKRLQIQERMTTQIAKAIELHLNPAGVGVVIRAHHSCIGCRGANQPDAEMITSAMYGKMRERPEARGELLRLLS